MVPRRCPGRWAHTQPVVGSGDRTVLGRPQHAAAPLAGSAAARPTAWGAGSAGPLPDGPGAPALGAAGPSHQTGRVHGWVSAGERYYLPGEVMQEEGVAFAFLEGAQNYFGPSIPNRLVALDAQAGTVYWERDTQ